MIRATDCMPLVLGLVPGFQADWDAYLADWPEGTPGLCLDMASFSWHIHRRVAEGSDLDLPAIFALIERLVTEGDDTVQTAATTCFLENLQNVETPPEAWVPLLGPASRDYCRAWDEFTGAFTRGLWEDHPERYPL